MTFDLPAISDFLSQPITAVEVALPTSLEGRWPWPSKVRTNLAAIRTATGSLFFHYGAVLDPLMVGISEGEWFEGYCTAGTLTLVAAGDAAAEQAALARRGVLETRLELEMVDLSKLFPKAGRIFVPGKTACEVAFTQLIRDGRFLFDVSGIRIYSSEATVVLERGSGAVLECEVQS